MISRHLSSTPIPPLYTPYSSERSSSPQDDLPYTPLIRKHTISTSNMGSDTNGKLPSQAPHNTLLIPGPIEFDTEVLNAMSHYAESHVGLPFCQVFGETLSMLRKLFQTEDPSSQPFVIAGSGTLGWDMVAANLIEPGEDVLVLHTGYFANSFADCFETYGAKPTQLKAEIGDRPQLNEIEKALKEKKYRALTVTHVDTSTGVLSEIEPLSQLLKRVSPETLLIVDGVCSVGCEEIRFDDWGIDCVLTASQKAIGCPRPLNPHVLRARYRNLQGAQVPARLLLRLLQELAAHHAELRGQETLLLRHTPYAARPRFERDPQAGPRAPRLPSGSRSTGRSVIRSRWQ